jgi:two-component system sensor histidine kinase KdpD
MALREWRQWYPLRVIWPGYVAAVGVVAVVTAVIGLISAVHPVANISLLYLIAVLATASWYGSGAAILASIGSFLLYDWFFVEPIATFTVADPEEWVSLLTLLVAAVITGQLAAGQRRRATEAVLREREAVVLYDVVRLMSEPNLAEDLKAVAERLRDELVVAAVYVELRIDPNTAVDASAGYREALAVAEELGQTFSRMVGADPALASTAARLRDPSSIGASDIVPLLRTDKEERLYFVPVVTRGQTVGVVVVVRHSDSMPFSSSDDRLLSAVSVQLGLAVDRARLRREATENEILRRSDDLKTALLHAVSHDLRTPLASIIASAGSLRQDDVVWTEDERRGFATDIEAEAIRLNRLVGNLLDLSRVEAGNLRPELGWYDLGALVDEVVGRLRPADGSRRVVVEVPDTLPPIELDFVQIDQVLTNLLGNAVKYSPATSEIRVVVVERERDVRVDVEDHGPGVPENAIPRLFEPFYRVDGPGPKHEGTGLGLAVARGLVEAHGGRIWAENRPDGGARFSFTLPLKRTSIVAPLLEEARP